MRSRSYVCESGIVKFAYKFVSCRRLSNFKIDIIDHHWIDNDPENETDQCSHGKFILTIGDKDILTGDDKIGDWTTSTSVLRLLRTIEQDFVENRDFGIILHCGMIHMISCNISIDWILVHKDDKVIIKEIKKYLTNNNADVIDFKGLIAVIDIDVYKNEILKVAEQVKDFFKQSKARIFDVGDAKGNVEFWREFDGLIAKHSK